MLSLSLVNLSLYESSQVYGVNFPRICLNFPVPNNIVKTTDLLIL